MTQIVPVILCGGSGTRLWPVSRKAYPKQFCSLANRRPLFQDTVARLTGKSYQAPIVISGTDLRFIVAENLADLGCVPERIVIEPEGRNTAPAVLAAALIAAQSDPEAIVLVAPSDHVIPDADAFTACVEAGLQAVAKGHIVTFGVTPDRAETGYGYLRLTDAPTQTPTALPLDGFVEKPDRKTAEEYLASDKYLWNAGLFLFAAKDMIQAYQTYAADLIAPVTAAVEGAVSDLDFLRLASEPWSEAENISIDFAIMEKIDNISVVPFRGRWSDLGSWDAVRREMEPDENGVAMSGPATAIDCRNTLLHSASEDIEMVGIGLENIIAIATSDAVLIADSERADDVKLAVDRLKAKGSKQAVSFPIDHRPWGHFETLALAGRFQVKRIVVKPGAALSLQSHIHRAEHWIVVEGTARVTIGDTVQLVTENQSVYVPLGETHRMENPGKVPMVLVEVQTGSYLGEDDIIRYEDVYDRVGDSN